MRAYLTIRLTLKKTAKEDVELHNSLIEKRHPSPFEHCAKASPDTQSRNFRGFMQYREIIGM